jgi:hypothetical protein
MKSNSVATITNGSTTIVSGQIHRGVLDFSRIINAGLTIAFQSPRLMIAPAAMAANARQPV